MSSKERRQKEREEVRAKILDAARDLFVTEGYDAVSMRKIADKIDYTATALYTHFADKDALLLELCNADFMALRDGFEKIARVADPIERLRALGLAYVEFAVNHPGQYRFMFMTPRPEIPPEDQTIRRGDPDEDAYAFLKATVADVIASGRLRDEYADADMVAQIFWSGVHGLVALRMTKGNDRWIDWRPLEDTAHALFEVTLRGVLKP